jgi:transcription elongation factor Elf1
MDKSNQSEHDWSSYYRCARCGKILNEDDIKIRVATGITICAPCLDELNVEMDNKLDQMETDNE